MAAVATATLTGCGSRENKVETTDFVDDVKVALADSGRIDLNALQWTREPKAFEVKGASSAPRMARSSARCASATCMPVPMKSASASMPARPRSHPSRQSSRT